MFTVIGNSSYGVALVGLMTVSFKPAENASVGKFADIYSGKDRRPVWMSLEVLTLKVARVSPDIGTSLSSASVKERSESVLPCQKSRRYYSCTVLDFINNLISFLSPGFISKEEGTAVMLICGGGIMPALRISLIVQIPLSIT